MIATVIGAMDQHRRQLSACMGAPGPPDFAVRDDSRSSVGIIAATASRLACRDDRDPPLCIEAGWRQETAISEKTKEEYFCAKDWTSRIALHGFAKIDFLRRQLCKSIDHLDVASCATSHNVRLSRFARRAPARDHLKA
ncbi:hypothetical protein [Bradyrhizobium sp. STM 3562]|uniref:hypothetical protein n=1 Tax=Bradyrhizobium sp. STM 3562 TaxID=578924 RepID=UPI00388F646F